MQPFSKTTLILGCVEILRHAIILRWITIPLYPVMEGPFTDIVITWVPYRSNSESVPTILLSETLGFRYNAQMFWRDYSLSSIYGFESAPDKGSPCFRHVIIEEHIMER
jgi:hypothetical protein